MSELLTQRLLPIWRGRRAAGPAPLARLACAQADYERLGLSHSRVEQWEDGARTDDRRGTYEWWYFDANLADGTRVVVCFMNKELITPHKPLEPRIRIDIELPDGRRLTRLATFPAAAWSADADHADVRLDGNRFCGDLQRYRIVAAAEEVSVDITLEAEVPAWRPETGQVCFGKAGDREFSWLVAVPQGKALARYRIDGVAYESEGVGYHDHNWGNAALSELIHDWYWARGQAGPYSVIAAFITAQERYGAARMPLLMLARDGRVIADDATAVSFSKSIGHLDEVTRKPVAGLTTYSYDSGQERYVVSFERRRDMTRIRMPDVLPRVALAAARLKGLDSAYHRFAGQLSVERYDGGDLVEQASDEAMWELMYFGQGRQWGALARPNR